MRPRLETFHPPCHTPWVTKAPPGSTSEPGGNTRPRRPRPNLLPKTPLELW
ncbi:hypothetical protein D187_001691 [Cystobacter fuscus DSM 2262]|uniref:Uncharacterized protein n=1 Tax=Cystobacter fuscus (strain ATCC 25194 / DSM 2262 / NBRC 100088 / M29) TaxID=1242864 RepID=S9QID9_CYSF2|nr:hypothetical protein D187_001691 [Cystobacter fuscus DSM 2262]